MSLLVEQLKTKTERTVPIITDLLALQLAAAGSDWYKLQLGTLISMISNGSLIPSTYLITDGINVYADPLDLDPSDGIDCIVENLHGTTIRWKSNTTYYEIASPATITLDAPDVTNPRIDLIFLTVAGALDKRTGTPGATPVEPSIGVNEIGLAFVLVNVAGTTVFTNLSQKRIVYVDKNGLDTNTGHSINDSLLTLNHAVTDALTTEHIEILDANSYLATTFNLASSINGKDASITNALLVTTALITITGTNIIINVHKITAQGTGSGANAIVVNNGCTLHLWCDEIQGNIVVNTGGILYAHNRIKINGTVTNNGTIYGFIGEKLYNRLRLNQTAQVSSNGLTLGHSNYVKITTNTNEIRLINSADWNGGSPIILEVISGQLIKHNYAPSTTYHPILFSTGADFTAGSTTYLILVYDSTLSAWNCILNLPSYTTSTIINYDQSVIQASNITAGNNITITVDNNVDFIYELSHEGEEIKLSEITSITNNVITVQLPYDVKIDEEFTVRYAFETETNIIPPALLVAFANEAYTESDSDVTITFDLISTNPVDKYVNLVVTLNGDARVINRFVGAGLTVAVSLTFYDLPAATYAATITGDITDSLAGIVVPANAASYDYTMLACIKLSNTSVRALCTVENTGTAVGTTFLKTKIDAGNVVNLSEKTIAIGETVTFEHIFTGVGGGAHTIYFQDSAGNAIDDETITLTSALPTTVQRNRAGYVYSGVYYENNITYVNHGGGGYSPILYLNFLMIGVNAGFTDIKLVYPEYAVLNNKNIYVYKYLNGQIVSLALITANAIPANLVGTFPILARGGPSLLEHDFNLGAPFVAFAAGKTELNFVLTTDAPSSQVSMALFKLRFEY